ncbi:MAG: SdrD B-like domain-containing protein [Caldilineaceae bacterium]
MIQPMFRRLLTKKTAWVLILACTALLLQRGAGQAKEWSKELAQGTIPEMTCSDPTKVTLGVLSPTMPAWCMNLLEAPGTFQSAGNSWVDEFDHGLSMAGIGPGYKVFTTTNNHDFQAAHFRHNNHWMVDLKGESLDNRWGASTLGGVTMRPDRTFRFENGKLVIEAVASAGIAEYGLHAWPEIDVTTAPAPTGKVVDGLYGYGIFGGHWTVGIRLQSSREPIAAMYDNTGRTFFEGGRQFEISFFQNEGAQVTGGTPLGAPANAWRVCKGTNPDVDCRDLFRWELTRDTITLYVNGVKYMEHRGLPPGKQLPDELLNGDVYVYFSSWMSGTGAEAIRYHWDRIAVNPAEPGAPPASTPQPTAPANPQPTATPPATATPEGPCDNGLTAEVETSMRYGAFQVVNDAKASNGQAVEVDESFGERRTPDSSQRVVTCFNVPADGTYRLKGDALSPDSGSNSFFVQLDDKPATLVKWHLFVDRSRYRTVDGRLQGYLSAGRHWVTVYLRQDGTRLDKLALVQVADGSRLPGTIDIGGPTMTSVERSAIHGRVWQDLNSNGIHDEGEPGVAGAVLRLYSAGGLSLTSTVSTNDGLYAFADSPPAAYVVYVQPGSLPINLLPSYDRDDEPDNRTTVELDAWAPWLDVDFGYRPADGDFGDGVTCLLTDPVSQTACQTQMGSETEFPSWMVVKQRNLLPVVSK